MHMPYINGDKENYKINGYSLGHFYKKNFSQTFAALWDTFIKKNFSQL